MLTRLLWQPVRPARAQRVYYMLGGGTSFLLVLGFQVVVVLAVALGGNIWLVLAALWGRGAAGALAAPIRSAWVNRNLSSRTRATVISMTSQLDAVGQVVGGPPLGALANRTSTAAALVASAVMLSPGRSPVCGSAAGPHAALTPATGR